MTEKVLVSNGQQNADIDVVHKSRINWRLQIFCRFFLDNLKKKEKYHT